MRKVVFLVSAFILSLNTYAGNVTDLTSALSTIPNANAPGHSHPLAIIYGGHDFPDSQIAIANESVWTGQPTSIG